MFDVYTGSGQEKKMLKKAVARLNDAILEAWNIHDKERCHVGILKESIVVFNTNFSDPEFMAAQSCM